MAGWEGVTTMAYMGRVGPPELHSVQPLPPGADPWQAIDAETRDAIVNWTSPAPEPDTGETSFGDRVVGGLIGAGIGAAAGFLLLNGLGRGRYRAAIHAKPMNVQASLTWAGIGAAIGALSGFARGRSPIESDSREKVVATLGTPSPPVGNLMAGDDPITGVLSLANRPATSVHG